MKKGMCLALALLLLFCSLPVYAVASEMTHEVVIAPQYEEVGRFSDGYAPVKIDGKWGYINEMGEMVVEATYDWAGICSEGVAITLVETTDEFDTGYSRQTYHVVHLVNMDGTDTTLYYNIDWDIPLRIGYYYDDEYDYDSFTASAARWYCNEGVICVADIPYTKEGNRIHVLNPDAYIDYPQDCSFLQIAPCFNGIIPMIVTEPPTPRLEAMYIDTRGNIIRYEPSYRRMSCIYNDMSMVLAVTDTISSEWEEEYIVRWGLMDSDNNWLTEPQFIDYLYTTDGILFHNDLMPVQTESGKWGAISTSGELVIDAQYDVMSCFNYGFSRVTQNGECFFIDTTGKKYTIQDLNGDNAHITLSSKVSNEGLAAVYDATSGKAYYVNVLAEHDGVIPAVTGSDVLGLESYVDSFGEDGTPESMAIPSSIVPIKEGDLWGFAKLTFAESNTPFTDVPTDSFYYEPVMWAIENNITNGLTATEFGPDATCNRAQVVTFLWRAAGSPEPETTVHSFVDVQKGSFYEKAVLWAVEKGITTGTDAAHFSPGAACNRATVVTFLYRAFESPAVSTEGLPFTDVPAGAWYEAPIAWAVEQGVTNGLTTTTFGPTQSCNRAQVVTFLYRAYND